MNNYKLQLGTGIVLGFEDVSAAVAAATSPLGLAFKHVDDGNILRFDAMTGADVKEQTGQTDLNGAPLLDDKFYGTLLACGLVVGPFERKSQAMNGLALSLLGMGLFDVVGTEAAEAVAAPEETEEEEDEDVKGLLEIMDRTSMEMGYEPDPVIKASCIAKVKQLKADGMSGKAAIVGALMDSLKQAIEGSAPAVR